MKIDESNFLYSLTSIRQRLFKFLEEELAGKDITGISPSFGDVLFVLEKKGPMTSQDLARHTLKDKSTISAVIKRLEAGGYIARERDIVDGRYSNLSLTPKAKRLKPVLSGISRKMNQRLFDGMSEKERETLFRLMAKIHENAG